MSSVSETPIIIKHVICKICGLSNEETRFQVNRRSCIKCNSKKCYDKIISERGLEYFAKKMKEAYKPYGIKGRPRKKPLENFEN
jgi:hypothetical protein